MKQVIFLFDLKVLTALNDFVRSWGFLNKILAEWLAYLIPLALLWLWFFSEKSKKIALRAFLAIMLSWPVFSGISGNIIQRDRPFASGGVQELLFHRPTYSFPSDHAAALFALSFSLWFSGYRKLALFFFAVALVNSFARVAAGIHWPTDILAGLLVGLLGAAIVHFLDKFLDRIYSWLIRILKKVRLA